MSQHLPEAFGPLALEELATGEQASARDHLAACTSCAQVFARGEEAFAQLSLQLAPVTPPMAVWERITQRLDHTAAEAAADTAAEAAAETAAEAAAEAAALAFLVPRAATLLDLPESAARTVLDRAFSLAGWLDGPAPGCWYQEVEKGARLRTALAALVKLAPGARFPDHRHLGHERTLVLRGAYRTGSGRAAAGDLHEMAEGSTHELTAEPGGEVYYLSVTEGGVEVAGQVLLPAR